MVQLLVKYKADIMAPNIGGRTAYDLTSNEKIRSLLIDHGYDRSKVLYSIGPLYRFSPHHRRKNLQKKLV